jgi:uncharacterized protein YndB with AHSA1/START domain
MASAELVIEADRDTVWGAVVDPRTYPEWLVGAKLIRAVDPAWPAPGSRFDHRVGFGPVAFDDHTTVVEVDPGRLLVLRIRATFALQAVVRFELEDDPGGTHIRFEEEPARRLIGNLVRPVLDPLTHGRNATSLRRLSSLVTSSGAGRPGGDGPHEPTPR